MLPKPTGYLALFVGLLTGLSCGCNPGGALKISNAAPVTMRRTFAEGETEKYISEMKMTQTSPIQTATPGAGMSDITVTSDSDQKVEKVAADHKSADVTIKQSNFKFESKPDISAMMSSMVPKESTSKATIDDRNMMKLTMDANAMKSNPMAGFGAMFMQGLTDKPIPNGIALPEAPVKPGDTWNTPYTMLEMIGATGDIKNTYVGESSLDGKDVYQIKFEGHFPLGQTPAKAPSGSNPLGGLLSNIKGQIDITGEAFLDKSNCAIVSILTSTKNHMIMPNMMNKTAAPVTMDQNISISMKQAK